MKPSKPKHEPSPARHASSVAMSRKDATEQQAHRPGTKDHDEIKAKVRLDFLATMYKAMWDNINRHITITWQSVGILATSFAAATFIKPQPSGESGPIYDMGVSLVVIASCWVVAHAYDASEWANRNLQIISNIEREILNSNDITLIHPHIGTERPNKLLGYFRIQVVLALTLAFFALLVHVLMRARIDFGFSNPFSLTKWLPYLALIVGAIWAVHARRSTQESFKDFQSKLHPRVGEAGAV